MKRILFWTVFPVIILMYAVSCNDSTSSGPSAEGPQISDPDEIAASSMIAYFPMNSETDIIRSGKGLTVDAIAGDASFVKGRRGNAYMGSLSEAYLSFAVSDTSPLKAIKSYTVAFWLKTPPSGGASSMFVLNGGDMTMGSMNIIMESASNADSLALKPYIYDTAAEWKGQDLYIHSSYFLSDRWFHLVTSYDASDSVMSIYANGRFITDGVKYAGPVPADGGSQPLLGDLLLDQSLDRLYIGAWPKQVQTDSPDDWMRYFPGMIDELRVYDKALTPRQVKQLYDAEVNAVN